MHASLLVLVLVLSACSPEQAGEAVEARAAEAVETVEAVAAEEPTAGGLERVTDPSLVCMVNDRFMGVAQIPIEAAGQTYFGCCENCVERIQTDEAIRRAVDPVTGNSVDKATAVIGQDSEGNVLYFESEDSLSRYRTS